MHKKLLKFAAPVALLMTSSAVLAMPFDSFDPRSMAMGTTGVAVGDPSLAPFFNPAMLTASDPSKKYSIEFPIIGGRLYDPGNLHTNLQTVSDNGNLLTSSATSLVSSASTLTADINTMTTNVNSIAGLTVTTSNLGTLSTDLNTVKTGLGTISTDMTNVSTNSTNSSTYITKVNQTLLTINNQPLQGMFGAATVVGIPGNNWGFAFYADAWAAMGGTLEYKDSGTVSNITGALNNASTALTSSSNAISSTSTAQTSLTKAIADVNTANTACLQSSSSATCLADVTTAANSLAAANTALKSASSTLTTNAGTVTTQSNTVNNNTTLQSQIHLRGVVVEESGLSISHKLSTSDHSWSLGFTPKVMNLTLFDATLGANNGTSTSGVTGNDYTAKYSTVNFDMGVAKSYNNGWRTGVVVKNVVPQSFNFMSIAPGAATGSAQSATGTFNMNPQARLGVSHENAWSTVALDADMTRNDPVGLENASQFVGLGGELSAWGWAQLRAGYRADLLNPGQELISVGFGLSPRIPYFKPHLDLAVSVSKDAFTNGFNNATQAGVALKAGLNF